MKNNDNDTTEHIERHSDAGYQTLKQGRLLKILRTTAPFVAGLAAVGIIVGTLAIIVSDNDNPDRPYLQGEFWNDPDDHRPVTSAANEGVDAAGCYEWQSVGRIDGAEFKLCLTHVRNSTKTNDADSDVIAWHPGFGKGFYGQADSASRSPVEIRLRNGEPELVINAGKRVFKPGMQVPVRIKKAGGGFVGLASAEFSEARSGANSQRQAIVALTPAIIGALADIRAGDRIEFDNDRRSLSPVTQNHVNAMADMLGTDAVLAVSGPVAASTQ